jgi:uncharacterized membrane protein YdjX (TVP38/TMEM64 family)
MEALRDAILQPLQNSHPAWWLAAMMFLPLAGFPISPLWVAAGARLGPWWGSAAAVVSILVNTSCGYAIAARLFSDPIRRLLQRRNIKVPELAPRDEWKFILICRITPGFPLVIQNYLLGCARVNFGRYLLVTLPVQSAWAVGFVVFGSALRQSNITRIVLAAGLVVAVVLVISLLRSRLRGTRPAMPAVTPGPGPSSS